MQTGVVSNVDKKFMCGVIHKKNILWIKWVIDQRRHQGAIEWYVIHAK